MEGVPIGAKIVSQRRNREAVRRLFQSIVADFGDEPGKKIIRHIVAQAGRCRIWVPKPGPDPLASSGSNFKQLWRSTCEEFGRASGRAIMNKIMVELGGTRIRFPDHEVLFRIERNTKIRNLYHGKNYQELIERFRLSKTQINNIINEAEKQ